MLDTLDGCALDLTSEGKYRYREEAAMHADLNALRDSVVVSNEDSLDVNGVMTSLGEGGGSFLSLMGEDDIPDPRKTYIAMDPHGGEEDRLGHAMMDPDAKKYDLKSWTKDHPEAWSSCQILDWLYYTAKVRQLEGDICGEKFNAMNGQQLCGMSRQDFLMLEPSYGDIYYETLRELLKQADFRAPEPCSPGIHAPDSMLHEQPYHQTHQQLHRIQYPSHHHHHHPHQPVMMERHHHQYQHQQHHQQQQQHHQQLTQDIDFPQSPEEYINYDFDPTDAFQDVTEAHESSGYESDVSGSSSSSQLDRHSGDAYPFTECFMTGYPNPTRAPRVNQPVRRRPGRPPTKNGTDRKPNHRGRRPGHTSKGNHLWEFVREMLKDSACNPSLIKWEDKAEGVFRFMQSEMVAKKWGEKKRNPGMTYEKLSRAMRYYYKRGILERVDGRRLVYKFGPEASGWR